MSESASILEDRYGSGKRRSIDRRLAWIAGAVLLVFGLAFMLWNNFTNTNHVQVTPLSSGPVSDFEFEAKFEVTAPANSHVACAVEALSTSKATVGWKVVEISFGEEFTNTVSTQLYTTTPATAAHAKTCWIVEG